MGKAQIIMLGVHIPSLAQYTLLGTNLYSGPLRTVAGGYSLVNGGRHSLGFETRDDREGIEKAASRS